MKKKKRMIVYKVRNTLVHTRRKKKRKELCLGKIKGKIKERESWIDLKTKKKEIERNKKKKLY